MNLRRCSLRDAAEASWHRAQQEASKWEDTTTHIDTRRKIRPPSCKQPKSLWFATEAEEVNPKFPTPPLCEKEFVKRA